MLEALFRVSVAFLIVWVALSLALPKRLSALLTAFIFAVTATMIAVFDVMYGPLPFIWR